MNKPHPSGLPRTLSDRQVEARNAKTIRILTKLQERVGGSLRTSQRGVPHLVIGQGSDLSVAYFNSLKRVRVFTGYGSFNGSQKRYDFAEGRHAAEFIEEYLTAKKAVDAVDVSLAFSNTASADIGGGFRSA